MVSAREQDDPSDGDFPWWLLITLLIGVWLGYRIISDELYAEVFGVLARGIGITAFVTVSAFGLASALGLLRRLKARLRQDKTEHQSADR